MATTYAFQRGKFGGPVGCIFPFFRTISTESPLDAEFYDNIPAGYLKCKGQILNASQYPNLATVLGIGTSCIYRKTGQTLLNPNADGSGGQIQLPDLGSKYITASSTPGGYLNTTTINPVTNAEVFRAGVEVSLSSTTVNNQVLFSYQGDFEIPETNVPISGSILTTANSSTPSASVFETQILAHGHMSNISTGRSIAQATMFVKQVPRIWTYCNTAYTIGGENIPSGIEWISGAVDSFGSTTATTHTHAGVFPNTTSLSKEARMLRTKIAADSLQTSVRLNTDTTFKLDYIAPKFILCEYLIKF